VCSKNRAKPASGFGHFKHISEDFLHPQLPEHDPVSIYRRQFAPENRMLEHFTLEMLA
jgi:hypothetical protein